MARSARDCLLECLENLDEDELRRFKNKLNGFPVRKGYDNIPRGQLQKAEALDLTNMLVSYYTEEYAVKLTATVLKAINCKDRAERLLVATRNRLKKPRRKSRAQPTEKERAAPREPRQRRRESPTAGKRPAAAVGARKRSGAGVAGAARQVPGVPGRRGRAGGAAGRGGRVAERSTAALSITGAGIQGAGLSGGHLAESPVPRFGVQWRAI